MIAIALFPLWPGDFSFFKVLTNQITSSPRQSLDAYQALKGFFKDAKLATPLLCQAPQGLSTVLRAKLQPCTPVRGSTRTTSSLVSNLMPRHCPRTLLNLLYPAPLIPFLSLCCFYLHSSLEGSATTCLFAQLELKLHY
ncbi:hypothetical protein HJG60_011241 [Phyllostomus discolor]|uniref:Uncharacterized protein n=1 Tax=Phyllostomus discolor TaxID=89673 RepID=A0A834E5B2_9CHIR|nr:hypothetical protein HJG60_011241 [Phyllostomus discolor]